MKGLKLKQLACIALSTSLLVNPISGFAVEASDDPEASSVDTGEEPVDSGMTEEETGYPEETECEEEYLVSAEELNVRSGPGDEYELMGNLNQGDLVTVHATSGNWGRISYRSGTAYISTAYISMDSVVPQAGSTAGNEPAETATALSITSQPADQSVLYGTVAYFVVEAEGDGLTYQWQYCKSWDTRWFDSGMTGADTASFSIQATEDRNGQKYRCVITDLYGNTVISDVAVLTVEPETLVIYEQPENRTVQVGEQAVFSVSAAGSGLTYQWQYQKGSDPWMNSGMSGAKTSSVTIPAILSRNGQKYRCLITDMFGNQVYSQEVVLSVEQQKILIQSQPGDIVVQTGDTAKFSVQATGSSLTYQWQYQKGNDPWMNSGMTGSKTGTVSVPVTAGRDGQKYRCIITDSYGTTVISEVAVLHVYQQELLITSEPKSVNLEIGKTAGFTVQASGKNITYQWQYKKGNDSWTNSGMSGAKTSSISVPVTARRDGQKYRCIIKDAYGKTVTSTEATLNVIKEELLITSQPKDVSTDIGETAVFTVKASGNGLSYQWQYQKGNDPWMNSGMSGAKTSQVSIPVTAGRNSQKYRCVVTDIYGQKVISEEAQLSVVQSALTITSQPASITVFAGKTAVFEVAASGKDLTYQWQYQKGDSEWQNSGFTGARTSRVSVPVIASRDGQKYRCVITDAYGNKVISEEAVLTVQKEDILILSQPQDVSGVLQGTVSFSVSAQGGSDLTYQWQYLKAGDTEWKNSGLTGSKTATLSVEVKEDRNGQAYRCVVSNSSGASVISEVAVLTVTEEDVIILSQPQSAEGTIGSSVTFSVKAQSTGLTYQWQFLRTDSGEWQDSGMQGSDTSSVTVPVTAARNGQQYRCLLTNSSGKTVLSEAAVLTAVEPVENATMDGIDISHWQAGIDLSQVDYEFAICKASGGTGFTDASFTNYASTILNSGKLFGYYHFARDNGYQGTGAQEAEHFYNTVKDYIGLGIPVLDWEVPYPDPIGWITEFVDTFYSLAGVKCMLYLCAYDTRAYDWSSLAEAGYPLWLAQYATSNTVYGYVEEPWRDSYGNGAFETVTIHQYTGYGRLDGYEYNLDLDKFYGTSADWHRLCCLEK